MVWRSWEQLFHALLSFSFPPPGPHSSLLCWPYFFTEHFSILYPDAYSSRLFSLSSRNSRGPRSRSNAPPNSAING